MKFRCHVCKKSFPTVVKHDHHVVPRIQSLLKKECVTCDYKSKFKSNSKCRDCPFAKIYLQATKYDLPNKCRLPKHHLYYFLYHPELNFEFPPTPEDDHWVVHHKNGGSWDDRRRNLKCMLSGKHASLYNKRRVEDRTHPFLSGELARRVNRKRIREGTHNFLGGKLSRKQVKEGTHNLLGENNSRYNHKLLPWLETIPEDLYPITCELSKKLGFSRKSKLVKAIESRIKRNQLINLVVDRDAEVSCLIKLGPIHNEGLRESCEI